MNNTAVAVIRDYLFNRHMWLESNLFEYRRNMDKLTEIYFSLFGLDIEAVANEFVEATA